MSAVRLIPTAALPWLLSLCLGAQGTLKGRVTGPEGPIVHARVRVDAQADARLRTLFPDLLPPARSWTTETDDRGAFSLKLPYHSLYRAYAVDTAGNRVSLVRHDLRADSRVRLLMLRGSRPLIRQRPEGHLAYQILGRRRESQREFTIARGILGAGATLPLLPPGPYRIRLRTASGRAAQASFVLQPATDLVLPLRFQAPARLLLEGVEDQALDSYRVRLPEALRFGGEDEKRSGGGFSLPTFDLLLRIEIGQGYWESRQLGRIQPGSSYLVTPPRGPGRQLAFQTGPLAEGAHLMLLWREGAGVGRRLVTPGTGQAFPLLGRLPNKEILLFYNDGKGHRSIQTAPRNKTGKIQLLPQPGTLLEIQIQGALPREEFHPKLTLLARRLASHPGLTDLYPPGVYYADRRGRIRIPSLPAGSWDLLIEAKRHVSQPLSLEVGPKPTVLQRTIRLELGYRMHGRVWGPGAVPMAGVLVKLSHPLQRKGLGPLETQSDSEGRFVFEGLSDVRYNLEARTEIQGHTWSARRGQIPPGGEAKDLALADEDPIPPGKRH